MAASNGRFSNYLDNLILYNDSLVTSYCISNNLFREEDVKCTSPKVAKIVNILDEPKEEARSVSPYDKCSSSSLVDDIIVYKNGCKLDIWTCDLCKCIFLDKVIISKALKS